MTSPAIRSAELVTLMPGLLGSSVQITTASSLAALPGFASGRFGAVDPHAAAAFVGCGVGVVAGQVQCSSFSREGYRLRAGTPRRMPRDPADEETGPRRKARRAVRR